MDASKVSWVCGPAKKIWPDNNGTSEEDGQLGRVWNAWNEDALARRSRKEFAGILNKAAGGGGISVVAQDGLFLGSINVCLD